MQITLSSHYVTLNLFQGLISQIDWSVEPNIYARVNNRTANGSLPTVRQAEINSGRWSGDSDRE